MEKTKLETLTEKLPQIITGIETKEEDGIIKLTGIYRPTKEHSETFCHITKDTNPIHNSISPNLLQFSALDMLAKEIIESKGIDYLDYQFVKTSTNAKNFVVNNWKYLLSMQIDIQNSSITISATLTNPIIDQLVYNFDLTAHKEEPEGFSPKTDNSKFVHRQYFNSSEVKAFSCLIGGKSLERTLYSIAISSSVVFDAAAYNKLSMEKGLMAVYDKQDIYYNTQASPNLAKPIVLELFLSERERFGKLTKKDEATNMEIVAKNSEGKQIYLSRAMLKFPREELLETKLEIERRRLERATRATH